MKALLAAVAVMVATAAVGADVPTFRGLRFGEPLASQAPVCVKAPQRTPVCREKTGNRSRVNFVDGLGTLLGPCVAEELDGKLVKCAFGLAAPAADQLAALLTVKYGKPTSSRAVPWQARGGVKGSQRQRVWEKGDLILGLIAPTDSPDQGLLNVYTPAWLAHETPQAVEKKRTQ